MGDKMTVEEQKQFIRENSKPGEVHYRVGENMPACVKGGDNRLIDTLGLWLVDYKDLVDCVKCKEWMHA